MRKCILLILTQTLVCQAFSDSSNSSSVGSAVKQGKSCKAAIAWSVAGISLLIAIGVITAIAIQNESN